MLSLTAHTFSILSSAADAAIDSSLTSGGGWLTSPPSSEPDAVAAIVSAGLPATATAWSPTLRALGYRVQITGVFCHSTPQVQFAGSGGGVSRCELADILVVVDEVSAGSTVDRRARLIQAKLASHPTKTLHGSDLKQLDLYQRWPNFKFVSSAYRAHSRNFVTASIGGVGESGRYGMIDLPAGSDKWREEQPVNPLSPSGPTLGAILVGMVSGAEGRAAIPAGADDWSDTIEELLSVTAATPAGGFSGAPARGTSSIACFAFGTEIGVRRWISSGYGYGGRGAGEDVPEREDGPISLAHVELVSLQDY